MTATSDTSKPRRGRSSSRIDARLTPEQKTVIQHAADLENRSISDFVIESAYAAAERTIREHEIITLTARESRRFAELLLEPPDPSENLRSAVARYRSSVTE